VKDGVSRPTSAPRTVTSCHITPVSGTRGCPGVCVPVLMVVGWVCYRVGGGRSRVSSPNDRGERGGMDEGYS
jgi:hypothetical protein